MLTRKTIQYGSALLVLLTVFGCSTISKFDQYAYTQATSLKVDALNVMGHANEPYQNHKTEVIAVQTAIDKMFEYEKNRPKNNVSEKMWVIVKDSSGHLFGGFVKRWQKENTLDAAFIKETQQLVSNSFDQISQLESGKIKPTQVAAN
ncbi:hypothetical protein [Dyadobacter sp. NIV53]|uniref:hypothetical protein n=1 Tax=Dyadobacter sp. NIV53 TaxID=2861765 RepID=UPI001C87E865|nr:hypothetical protein [Dyadobacter sp. NIV53]